MVGVPHETEDTEQINRVSIMGVTLALHVAIIIGYTLNEGFAAIGLKLPLFISWLLVVIVMSNTIPYLMPKLRWPARWSPISTSASLSPCR